MIDAAVRALREMKAAALLRLGREPRRSLAAVAQGATTATYAIPWLGPIATTTCPLRRRPPARRLPVLIVFHGGAGDED